MLYPNKALNFWDARNYCKKEGGDLAMLLNSTEHLMMWQAFVDAGVSGNVVWIGLASKGFTVSTDRANWAWLISGQTPTDDSWRVGEPNNFGGWQGVCAGLMIDLRDWVSTDWLY